MARITQLGHLPAHDLMFGFSPDNIADRLTIENWTTRALLRKYRDDVVYIMILRAVEQWNDLSVYLVRASSLGETTCDLSARFLKLEEALAYVNGEDGGAIATGTVAVPAEEYPAGEAATVSVFTSGRL